jgi:hypothetical protein
MKQTTLIGETVTESMAIFPSKNGYQRLGGRDILFVKGNSGPEHHLPRPDVLPLFIFVEYPKRIWWNL